MGSFLKKSAGFFSFFIISAGFFISCSQATADIKTGEMSVIFEYQDEESLPSARLCLFIESESDTRRSEELLLSSPKEGFEWSSRDLIHIKSGDRSWSGYTNFVMQRDQHFPCDSYSLVLRNADENQALQKLDFSYDEDFYEIKACQAEEKMKEAEADKKIAIYDEKGILLYYDIQTDNLNSVRKMWNMFSNASYYNIVWQAKDKTVLCIMPKRLVIPDEN